MQSLIKQLKEKLQAQLVPHLLRWLPPAYVKAPVYITYAYDVSDAVILTMERILGICFEHGGRQTPALAPGDMETLLGRSKTTMYRHFEILTELKWIEWEQVSGRRIRVRPLVFATEPEQDNTTKFTSQPVPASTTSSPEPDLLDALKAAGIEYPFRDKFTADPKIDADQVRAWHLWTRHPDRANLENPAGVIIRRLEVHEPPPDEYLALARVDDEDMKRFEYGRWGRHHLPEHLRSLYPLYREIFGDEPKGDYSDYVVT